jgi:glycosyltransferase domain-containing protein
MSGATTDSQLTVVVATSNRPAVLRRQLRYLSDVEFRFRVVIADSSSPEFARENRTAVATTTGLKLHYGYSEAGHLQVCRNVLKRLITPYAAVFSDGDFAFPTTLEMAIDFLEAHPGFGSAVGITVSDLARKGRCYVLPARSIKNDSPVVRFRTLARDWFSTVPGVHRTKLAYETYRNASECSDFLNGRQFSEVILSQMAALQSRIHLIPRIACLQEDREPALAPRLATAEDSQHREHFQRFHQNLVDQLEAAGATLDHAELMIEQLYGHLRAVSASIVARKPPGMLGKIQRETIRHYGHLVNLIRSDRILQRRTLRSSDLIGLKTEWKQARHLIARYPDGMSDDQRTPIAA